MSGFSLVDETREGMVGRFPAFVKTIASVCRGVPHRYGSNHFLRDLAKPVLELDSHAKIQVRGKIPGGQVKGGQ